jgi:hypothetical protein
MGAYEIALERGPRMARYWNGRQWSAPFYLTDPVDIKCRAALRPAESQRGVLWRAIQRR